MTDQQAQEARLGAPHPTAYPPPYPPAFTPLPPRSFTPSDASPVPPLAEALDRLEGTVHSLGMNVELLETRLSPVRAMPENVLNEPVGKPDEHRGRSVVARRIEDQVSAINGLASRINRLTAELET